MSNTVLDVRNLSVEFPQEGKPEPAIAVNNISFQLQKGEILGIVGESGSGKSVTSLAIMGLIPTPGKISEGEINFYASETPENLRKLKGDAKEWQEYRGAKIAMIFQEPMSSFNPVYTIGYQLAEAIKLHQKTIKNQQQANDQAINLLRKVKIFLSDKALENQYLIKLLISQNYQIASLNEEIENYIKRQNKFKDIVSNEQLEDLKNDYLVKKIGEQKNNYSGSVNEQIKNYIKQEKDAFLKRYPHELSGGQLQRVMIAMAISCNPTLLIADEPTTALDVTVQKEILILLRDLCKSEDYQDMSMIFISHDLGVINEIADKVVVMYQGEIVEQGDKNQILYYPQHKYTQGLLACRPRLESQLDRLPTVNDFLSNNHEKQLLNQVQSTVIASEKKENYIDTLVQKPEPLLTVKNLTVEFGKPGVFGLKKESVKAVDDISFEVYPGETLGLVGESGCGKSTLARTILRLIPCSKGEIYYVDEASNQRPIHQYSSGSKVLRRLRQEMQIVFQNPYNSLNPRLTIGQAIMEPMVIHNSGGNAKQRKERVNYLLETVGLQADWINRYPHEFSGGQRQRVCIARALALNPRFIICDESVSALDVSVQAQVLNLLKDLQEEFKLTYIFISHDLSVVRFMSDRIMVMNKGKIEELGSAENIINNPIKDYTKKLISSIPQFPDDLSWLEQGIGNISF
ncbi:ABC transporter related [Rippkaea orientalis PCC 8801]|uniref:ABC transporter related n=1 Tax=Rippkaea orientalis (strain PCC 8801 / RF-1) TaxID=41431 RepID=B7JZS2_RIPO1|nr:ABC transporter ATP-binding protein [Rippkaea orientalis]ACK65015.1 ABC transporter related [Rippkaea orientalis PCC 8801]